MMNNLDYKPIPKPDIRFDAKSSLKRRSNVARIAWISSSVAAMLVMGGLVYNAQTVDKVVVATTLETVDTVGKSIDKVVGSSVVENAQLASREVVEPESAVVKVQNKLNQTMPDQNINTPPPISKPAEEPAKKMISKPENTAIDSVKREIMPKIIVKPELVLAQNVKTEEPENIIQNNPNTVVVMETVSVHRVNPNLLELAGVFTKKENRNSNLDILREKNVSENENLRTLFDQKPKSRIVEFFSKKE